jgi:hypothetical protein
MFLTAAPAARPPAFRALAGGGRQRVAGQHPVGGPPPGGRAGGAAEPGAAGLAAAEGAGGVCQLACAGAGAAHASRPPAPCAPGQPSQLPFSLLGFCVSPLPARPGSRHSGWGHAAPFPSPAVGPQGQADHARGRRRRRHSCQPPPQPGRPLLLLQPHLRPRLLPHRRGRRRRAAAGA